ncbi:hypothetical protein GGD65_004566 [Bradyrhizobium sp. CIR18]|uniref:hypothetical protein n=1 Tax=Bradyrhizobium sp. CIR18 TaxID=2663839 RepID=UPI0016056EF8|nr:hypothetical protein [Bradyrhizobium sp. CIR18]MBB4363521.1 hypothetical protein [Bradyrhizobium sp. CIR18]
MANPTVAMPDQLPIFETHLKKRGRTWKWYVCTTDGDVVIQGSESRRRAARYNANRALLLTLLSVAHRSVRRGEPEPDHHISRRSRSAGRAQRDPLTGKMP